MEGETGAISQAVNMSNQSFEPSWAPDCQGLAFTVGTNNDFDVYTIDDANAEPVLLPVSEPDIYNWSAAWSPTGEVIAYQHNKDALMNVCFNDGNGNHLSCMERDNFSNAMPAWSPNGDSFAFGSNRDGDWDLYLSPYPPTGDLVRLTDNKDIDFHPRFSPDGERIIFASKRGGNYDIYVINADGSGEVQLTSGSSDERTPVWVGNDLIAFSLKHFENENWELYLVNADGTNAQRLTFIAGTDQWPAWCPTQ
jgi:TolB protein